MQSKLNSAVMCVYVAVGIQLMTALYGALKFSGSLADIGSRPFEIVQLIASGLIWTLALAAVAVWATKEIKAGSAFGWVGCISVLVFSLPSLAFPAAALGLLFLADKSVRGVFLPKLDIQL